MKKHDLRKLLTASVLLLLCLIALPTRAQAVTGGQCGDNAYWTLEDGVLTVSGTGAMYDSEEYRDSPFYSIRDQITAIVIEDGITSIGDRMFGGCAVQDVSIGKSVERIGQWTFTYCTELQSIVIPDNVTFIDDQAFFGCEGLQSLDLGNGVKYIGGNAFENCESLQSVTIPDSVETIDGYAFSHCIKLKSVEIGDGVKNIGAYAFRYCFSLENVDFGGNEMSLGEYVFYECGSLQNINIGNGVKYIGEGAFFNCDELQSVTIADSVTEIGSLAFYSCEWLHNVTIGNGVKRIDACAFEYCPRIQYIIIGNGVESIGGGAFYRNDDLWHVLYTGTEAQWEAITIEENNECLTSATRHYNAVGTEVMEAGDGRDTCTVDFCLFCTICEEYLTEEIEGGTHTWSDSTDKTPRRCADCGTYECEELGHSATAEVTPPTCGEQGYTTYTCTCGCTYVDDYVEPTGKHDFGMLKLDYCIDCGKKDEADHEHEFVLVSSGGCWYFHTELFACTICGSTYTQPAPSGHYHPYTYEISKAQTETEAGVVTVTCQECGDTYTVEIPAGKNAVISGECGENVDWSYDLESGVFTISGEGDMIFERKSVDKFGKRTVIPWGPFAGDIKEVVLEDGITSIDDRAFYGFAQVKNITIPAGVTAINDYVFSECEALETVVFEGDAPNIQEYAFNGTTVTAYYPAGNETWTEDKLQNYKGTITWLADGIDCEHVETILPGKEPTCTQTGLTDGKVCSECGMILVAQQTIPVKEHVFEHEFDYKCDACGQTRIVDMTRPMVDMFRMYDPNSGEHFYTGSMEERQNLESVGWQYEGVGFTFPLTTGKPVYRLYDPVTGEHLYTMDEAEKATLMAAGWNYEGIAFNSGFENEVPQYRLHNPNETRGAYHFTASIEEREYLISLGWEYQGIGWYSLGA